MAPTMAPPATMTIRSCLRVAPIAASMPSWRWRRAAITAKPAAATRETRSSKTVTAPRLPFQRAAEPGAEGAETGRAGVQQHRHRLRRACARGRDEDELVTQVAGILHDAGHRLVMAAEGQQGADAQLEGLRYLAGDGDLPGA